MRRRRFLWLVSGAAALAPLVAHAQRARRTIAVLMPYPESDAEVRARVAAFREELHKLGWSDEILHIEERWSTDDLERVRVTRREEPVTSPT